MLYVIRYSKSAQSPRTPEKEPPMAVFFAAMKDISTFYERGTQ